MILGLGTFGLFLVVCGAAIDYWHGEVFKIMAISGIVAAFIGMMMIATLIVKESTERLNFITCLDSRCLRIGGILTAIGGVSIFISLTMIEVVFGLKHLLLFIGAGFILLTGSIDLWCNYCRDDEVNVPGNIVAGNMGRGIQDLIHLNDIAVRNNRYIVGNNRENVWTNRENVWSDIENVGNDIENVGSDIENVGSDIENVGSDIENVETDRENVGTERENLGK